MKIYITASKLVKGIRVITNERTKSAMIHPRLPMIVPGGIQEVNRILGEIKKTSWTPMYIRIQRSDTAHDVISLDWPSTDRRPLISYDTPQHEVEKIWL